MMLIRSSSADIESTPDLQQAYAHLLRLID